MGAAELLDHALRLLGKRALSAGEVRQKLESRAASPEDVRQVVEKLRQLGCLDDRRFAEAFSTARLENEGFGKQRILRDLRRRRVAPAVAAEAARQAYAETDETTLIEGYLRRKFRGVPLPEYLANPRKLASAYRRLRLAGFSAGNTIRVLKRYAAQAEMLESLEEPPASEDAG